MMMSTGVWALCIVAATIVAYELITALVTQHALHGMFSFQKTTRPIAYWVIVAGLAILELSLCCLILLTKVDNRMMIN